MTEQTMKDDLKACPFCGGNAAYKIFASGSISVGCLCCFVGSVSAENKQIAKEYWNTRAAEPVSDDALREAVEHFDEKYIPSFSKKSKRCLETLINHALKGQKVVTVEDAEQIAFKGVPEHWQSPTAMSVLRHGLVELSRQGLKIIDGGE